VKQYFLDSIKDGRKTLEVRVAYDHVKGIQPGEKLRFLSRADSRVVLVKDVRRYGSFEEMLAIEDARRIAPGQAHDEVLALLKDIYPPDRERLGIIVLDIDASEGMSEPAPYGR
jgi:ASC-1-like (ASCH) protein